MIRACGVRQWVEVSLPLHLSRMPAVAQGYSRYGIYAPCLRDRPVMMDHGAITLARLSFIPQNLIVPVIEICAFLTPKDLQAMRLLCNLGSSGQLLDNQMRR